MNCVKLRNRLAGTGGGALPEEGRRHLEDCEACRRFADRLRTAHAYLREHHSGVEPDPAFAARVGMRLPSDAAELLGRAAARLLPATLALVALLAWFVLRAEPAPSTAEQSAPTDDLVTWVLDRTGEGP